MKSKNKNALFYASIFVKDKHFTSETVVFTLESLIKQTYLPYFKIYEKHSKIKMNSFIYVWSNLASNLEIKVFFQ